VDPRRGEVLRIFERYLVEIVETYELCPWARSARVGGELAVDVVWGTPSADAWVGAAQALLASPQTRVAMVIAPELDVAPAQLRALRDRVASRLPAAGVAEFHPAGVLDHATPARLVPFLRRSPDPLLQLVPFAVLDAVRAPQLVADRAQQAQLLVAGGDPPKPAVADRIAAANHARVTPSLAELTARLDAIAADRAASYARVRISTSR
jgi:hypothetical protein